MGGRGVGVTSLLCSSLPEEKTNKGDAGVAGVHVCE